MATAEKAGTTEVEVKTVAAAAAVLLAMAVTTAESMVTGAGPAVLEAQEAAQGSLDYWADLAAQAEEVVV